MTPAPPSWPSRSRWPADDILIDYARNQPSGIWESFQLGTSLADQRVLIIGYGHIGAAIERRLSGFEVASVTRVARRPRTGPGPGARDR